MTLDEITSILGPVDAGFAAELVATGVNADELLEAFNWLNNDEALISEGRPSPGANIARLIEMLEPTEDVE